MPRNSVIGAVLMAALLTAGCSSSTGNQASSSTTVRVLYHPNAELIPMFVANDAGLFKKLGLNVTLKDTDPSAIIPAVTARSAEMGMTTAPALLLGVQNGLDMVVTAGGSVNTPDNPRIFLVVGRGSGLTAPNQLTDKRISSDPDLRQTGGGQVHGDAR